MSRVLKAALLAGLALAVFGVYLLTMPPVFKTNDSPETTASAYTLGIAHPPGYPLYTMAGKVYTLFVPGNPGFRMNLFSAFLGLCALCVTFLLFCRISVKTTGVKNEMLCAAASLITAFTLLFWNQAGEAKGGIYIFNLLLLGTLLLVSFRLFDSFEAKALYLGAYVFGISLSNHWPSAVIVAPAFVYPLIAVRKELNVKRLAVSTLFFILGLTPYFYLYVRCRWGEPSFNLGNPDTLKGLFWVIMREGYAYPVAPGAEVLKYQLAEFFRFSLENLTFMLLLAAAGAYFMAKKAGRYLATLGVVFGIVFIMVVVYNRTKIEVISLMDIFLLPAQYAVLLVAGAGLFYANSLLKQESHKKIVIAAAFASALALCAVNYGKNDFSKDYLSYDFGNNILNTIGINEAYIGDGDYNLMPLYYTTFVQKRRTDIDFVSATFLIFDWGIWDFEKRFGKTRMQPYALGDNLNEAAGIFAAKKKLYISSHFPHFDSMKTTLVRSQAGLLNVLSATPVVAPSYYYDLYSYRGVFDKFCTKNKLNYDMAGWYPVCMVNQANALAQAGKNSRAAELYEKSLRFPNEKPEAKIYLTLGLARGNSGRVDLQLQAFAKAGEKTDVASECALAALHLYNNGAYEKAKELFDRAVKLGSKDERVQKALEILNKNSVDQLRELSLNRANQLTAGGKFREAAGIYNFLLEKGYKKAIIYRNIGVCHFQTNEFEDAVENFKASKNETPAPDVILYLAYTYYRMGNTQKALEELKSGVALHPGDVGLKNFYAQLQGATGEKNTDSGNGQR